MIKNLNNSQPKNHHRKTTIDCTILRTKKNFKETCKKQMKHFNFRKYFNYESLYLTHFVHYIIKGT